MTLKQTPDETLSLWLRVLLFGKPGTGKTYLGLHFPDLLVLDTERGADAYKDRFDFDQRIIRSIPNLMEQIEFLESGNHKYKTVMVDSLSDIFDYHQDMSAKQLGGEGVPETEAGISLYRFELSDYRFVNSDYRETLRRITMLNMNVICTAQEKDEYKKGGIMVPTGKLIAAAGKEVERYFETVVRLYTKESEYCGWCTKDRTGKVPMLKEFEPSYDYFASLLGEKVITQEPKPTDRCSKEQRKAIAELQEKLELSSSTLRKALSGYKADKTTNLTREQADELISRLAGYKEKKNATS
jgi:hypothetical protein